MNANSKNQKGVEEFLIEDDANPLEHRLRSVTDNPLCE